jgi:hypothetical protein
MMVVSGRSRLGRDPSDSSEDREALSELVMIESKARQRFREVVRALGLEDSTVENARFEDTVQRRDTGAADACYGAEPCDR